MAIRPRPELPTDGECGSFGCTWPKGHNRGKADIPANHERRRLVVTPTARFSDFPYDILARYINHKVEFAVISLGAESDFKWEVRKLT